MLLANMSNGSASLSILTVIHNYIECKGLRLKNQARTKIPSWIYHYCNLVTQWIDRHYRVALTPIQYPSISPFHLIAHLTTSEGDAFSQNLT
jgi:hypothetical protein